MSILTIRTALREAGIAGADSATMRLGVGETQVYTVGGVEVIRPAGESSDESAMALVAELTA
jgi:hypothetical protein